jgi:hypothetical protein
MEAEKRRVGLPTLEPVQPVPKKLQVLQAPVKPLAAPSSAEPAKQLGVQPLVLKRASWQEQIRWLATKPCRGAWGGEVRTKKAAAKQSKNKNNVGWRHEMPVSMERLAFRTAKSGNRLAMKAKAKISGAAEKTILGLAVVMSAAEEAEMPEAEAFSTGYGASSLATECFGMKSTYRNYL